MKSLDVKMMCLLLVVVLLAFAALAVNAEEEQDLFDRRHLVVSAAGDTNSIATSANVTFPISQINGGITAGIQRASTDGEIVSDEIDFRAEAGYDTGLIQAKAFVAGGRSLQKGTKFSREVGGYLGTPEISAGPISLELGAGSFFESVALREALGLEDVNVGRILAFARVSVWNVGAFFELTPQVQLDDVQLSIKPNVLFRLKGNVSLRIDGQFDYSSDPYGNADKWARRASLGLDVEF